MEPTIAVPRTKVDEQSIKIDLVNRFIKEGKFDQALRVLEKLRAMGESADIIEALQEDIAEKKHRARIEDLLGEGITFFDDDHFDLALECFNEALSIEPENTTVLEWVRRTHQKEAEKRLGQTIEKYVQLGQSALQQENFEEAKKLYSEALKLNPASGDLSAKLNHIQELIDERQRREQAAEMTRQAEELLAKDERDQARELCRQALQLARNFAPAERMLADIAATEKEEVVGQALQEMEALYLRKDYEKALAVAGAAVEQVGIDDRLTKSSRRILRAKRRRWLLPLLVFVTFTVAVVTVLVLRQSPPEAMPPPHGVLLLDIRPAVKVLELTNLDTSAPVQLAERETPLRLSLLPGNYRLSYQNRDLQAAPASEEFTIAADQTFSIRKTLPEFDADRVIQAILSGEKGP
jgi:tetratricopeptide (TPR) repeat protein